MEVVDLIMIICIIGSIFGAMLWAGEFIAKIVFNKAVKSGLWLNITALVVLLVLGALMNWLGVFLWIIIREYSRGIRL